MLEVYAFLVMFTAQIVVLTVLYPMSLIGRVRTQLARHPAERFPQLYPGGPAGIERQLSFYRLLNALIALIGAVLLVGFFIYLQRPDWDDGPVEAFVGGFFMLQLVPVILFMRATASTNKLLRSSFSAETRNAVLQRRSLSDFVSPFVVFVTLLCYPLFILYVIYIGENPFPGFAGIHVNIGIATALYAATAVAVYGSLYGKRGNPLQTHADRLHTIELAVKVSIYTCLAAVVFLSLNFTLVLFDLQRWEPLAGSAFLVICALLYLKGLNAGLIAPPRELNLDRLRSKPVS